MALKCSFLTQERDQGHGERAVPDAIFGWIKEFKTADSVSQVDQEQVDQEDAVRVPITASLRGAADGSW
jgi:hypothetical protein